MKENVLQILPIFVTILFCPRVPFKTLLLLFESSMYLVIKNNPLVTILKLLAGNLDL